MKVQINLDFIRNQGERFKVKNLLESLIKFYTQIPGKVEVGGDVAKGIITYNITDLCISPASDSSSSAPSPRVRAISQIPIPQMVPEFETGVELQGKFPGLPKLVIKYGVRGLTKDVVSKALQENPTASIRDIPVTCSKQVAELRRALNLYKLP